MVVWPIVAGWVRGDRYREGMVKSRSPLSALDFEVSNVLNCGQISKFWSQKGVYNRGAQKNSLYSSDINFFLGRSLSLSPSVSLVAAKALLIPRGACHGKTSDNT